MTQAVQDAEALLNSQAWAILRQPQGLQRLVKLAFVPAGATDPAAAGGAMPADPAAMGGAPPGDPAAMGGAMPPGMPPVDPAMAGAPPAAPPAGGAGPLPPELTAAIGQAVQQAMAAGGGGPAGPAGAAGGGKGGGGMKVTPEMQYAQGGRMMALLISIAKSIGASVPPEALNDAAMIDLATTPGANPAAGGAPAPVPGAAGMLAGAPPAPAPAPAPAQG